jgi:hypothetical protein
VVPQKERGSINSKKRLSLSSDLFPSQENDHEKFACGEIRIVAVGGSMTRTIIAAVMLAFAAAVSAMATDNAATDNSRCGGVLMAQKTIANTDHKAFVQELGFYRIDGGPVLDGKSTCTSIVIECSKAAMMCHTATATTTAIGGVPENPWGLLVRRLPDHRMDN